MCVAANHADDTKEWSDEENTFAESCAALVSKAGKTKTKAKRKPHTKAAAKKK